MKARYIVVVVGILALLAIATAAAAGTATLTVKVTDANNVPMSGASVFIQRGTDPSTRRVCPAPGTAAGLCKFTGVTTGVKWTIVAADKRTPPHTANKVDFLFTATTTVTLKIL